MEFQKNWTLDSHQPTGPVEPLMEYRMKTNTLLKGEPIFFANPTWNRVEDFKEKCGEDFKMIFYRTESPMETYAIPYPVIASVLTEENLREKKARWLTRIINGTLEVKLEGGESVSIDVSYYLQFELTTEVIKGDCVKGMKQIPNESVDCIITSPPYKEEDGYTEELMEGWLTEAFRILKNDTCMFVNFGHLAGKKERGFRVALKAIQIGFDWNDTITWVKNHYTPLQTKLRVNNLTEHIFLMTKGKPELDRLSIGVPYADKSNAKRYNNGVDLKCGGNVWYIKYPTIQKSSQKRHKDMFPVELPLRALKLSDTEGTIVDPFNGSGSTGTACIRLWKQSQKKINYIGFEMNPKHIQYSRAWWLTERTAHDQHNEASQTKGSPRDSQEPNQDSHRSWCGDETIPGEGNPAEGEHQDRPECH